MTRGEGGIRCMASRRRTGFGLRPRRHIFHSLYLVLLLLLLLLLGFYPSSSSAAVFNRSHRHHPSSAAAALPGIQLPDHLSFNSVTSSSDSECQHLASASSTHSSSSYDNDDDDDDDDDEEEEEEEEGSSLLPDPSATPPSPLRLQLKHRSHPQGEKNTSRKESVVESAQRDLSRIHTLHRRITERKNQNSLSRMSTHHTQLTGGGGGMTTRRRALQQQNPQEIKTAPASPLSGMLMATLESGVSQGSGEYFMDVFVGTPPRHFSLILDTGSDLNWIQCLPCHDCFQQQGPYYDPSLSSSYRNVTCTDPRCRLVSSPDPPQPCRSPHQPCPYFYWYGDRSNTTGDLALEIFTVNLTKPQDGHLEGAASEHRVDNVIFGCGHWNRGLFHGAAGLLGLGRGPLSFTSQLRSLYGHTFSYCLVDRNSDLSVSSKLILGEDRSLVSQHGEQMNYTSFVGGKDDNPADTFYYVGIKGIMVGGELLEGIPAETWEVTVEGGGGTIVDSGTTLSYFAEPAYGVIKEAFMRKLNKTTRYPLVVGFPMLEPCYNVSGVKKVELPEFGIVFRDGAVWNFPAENYFIKVEVEEGKEEVICLAMLGTPRSSLSILGNYQQQNFHILYDTKTSRLGFAPMNCASVQ